MKFHIGQAVPRYFKEAFERIRHRWEALDENPEWLVSREGWGAKPPKQVSPPKKISSNERLDYEIPMKNPVSYVVIHDTPHFDDPGSDSEKIKEVLREIQDEEMAEDYKRYYDIGYNFMVGADGIVYEGRGWTKEGAHTMFNNEDSIGVALIGNHKGKPPNSKILLATFRLIEEGVKKRYLKGDVKVVPHSHLVRGALCPTRHLEQAVERGVLNPHPEWSEWAWLWDVKRWLNGVPQRARDHWEGQLKYWEWEWKWCSTRQFINYYWHN